jgi:hypothetical protein
VLCLIYFSDINRFQHAKEQPLTYFISRNVIAEYMDEKIVPFFL